jgi:hypothetical protein
MKRFFAITIALLYFSISLGMVIDIQYCGKKVTHTSVLISHKNNCCGKNKRSCCKEHVSLLKINDVHSASHTSHVNAPNVLPAFTSVSAPAVIADQYLSNPLRFNTGPPLLQDNDIFIRLANLRI